MSEFAKVIANLAAREPNRVLLIDGSQSADKIAIEIWETLTARFPVIAKKSSEMAFSPKDAARYLRRAHEQNRLAHAYLISGPPGSGKRTVAAELAALVNGTDADKVFSRHAREIVIAEPESKSRRIVIEQVRELEHALRLQCISTAAEKVAIISEADRLQPQAANAFLKTLEEPPNNSLLLLLSAMPEVLPDTILSRCISIPLAADGRKVSVRSSRTGGVAAQRSHRKNVECSTFLSARPGFTAVARRNSRANSRRLRRSDEARRGALPEFNRRRVARRSRRLLQSAYRKSLPAAARRADRDFVSLVVGRLAREHGFG